MSREVRITLTTEHVETVTVADSTKLSSVLLESEGDDFFVIPTLDGGEYLLRKTNVVAVVKKGRGEPS